MKMKLNKIDFKEDELLELIEEEFEAYLDECDLGEDAGIDSEEFANLAKENIEHNQGKVKFNEYNIESYALEYANSNEDALFERCVDMADTLYEQYRESQWT